MRATVTILNKLAGTDSLDGLDVWYKTILKDVVYKVENVQSVNGTTVSVAQTFNILLPFSDNFKSYNEWKNLENREGHFTVSQGDYIIFEVVEEQITPNTVHRIKNAYEPNVCEVRSVVEVEQKYGVKYQLQIRGV